MIRRVLLGVALAAAQGAAFASEAVPRPEHPPGKGAQCVEPTDVMRRNHMELLVHQRVRTVRSGIRGARHSLTGCVGCHVARDADGRSLPINGAGQFCASCHRYAAVKIDCFECHAATPESGTRERHGLPRHEAGQ